MKLESSQSPPPLCFSPSISDKGRSSTSDSSPVATPVTAQAPWFSSGGKLKAYDCLLQWRNKPGCDSGSSSAQAKSREPDLFETDWNPDELDELTGEHSVGFLAAGDSNHKDLPLFLSEDVTMNNYSAPLDISSARNDSQSPRAHTSNLTSALQEAGVGGVHHQFGQHDTYGHFDSRPVDLPRHDSINNIYGSSNYGTGARPISVRDRQRRESNNAGSFMGGMSWGASSINGGDWVREDVMMAGTSPGYNQGSSFQSSSYLPKMEANFFRDYLCCGIIHPSLHDLMQHAEECHGQQSADVLQRQSLGNQAGFAFQKQQPSSNAQQQRIQMPQTSGSQLPRSFQPNQNKPTLTTIQDDPVDSMEFDEPNTPIAPQMPTGNMAGKQPFRALQQISTNNQNQLFSPLSSNPTVSSVNTPTLSTQSISKTTPDSSIPTTPMASNMGGFDATSLDMFGALNMPNGLPMMGENFDYSGLNPNLQTDFGGLTINDPAKQLTSKNGGIDNAQLQFAFNNGQFPVDNDFTKQLQQQQLAMGVGATTMGFPGHEEKKYKCPVIGCEKAYKNQNGLKYHKQHGHTNQKLKANEDGSYSIVDPLTSVPYPGTVGMEKEKPYRCEKCGKRYKNLNGLKYHRQHSPPCNPDIQNQVMNGMPGLVTLQQLQQQIPKTGML